MVVDGNTRRLGGLGRVKPGCCMGGEASSSATSLQERSRGSRKGVLGCREKATSCPPQQRGKKLCLSGADAR